MKSIFDPEEIFGDYPKRFLDCTLAELMLGALIVGIVAGMIAILFHWVGEMLLPVTTIPKI